MTSHIEEFFPDDVEDRFRLIVLLPLIIRLRIIPSIEIIWSFQDDARNRFDFFTPIVFLESWNREDCLPGS